MDAQTARKWSEWAQRHLLGALCFERSATIGLYAAFDNEVDTRLVFERGVSDGKTMALPRITGKGEMVFLKAADWEDMKKNKWGIPEPGADAEKVPINQLDLVVVPAVALDKNGCRIGFGGGYFDRLLKELKPGTVTVGLAYSFQVFESLPCEKHDQRVGRIVTERGFLKMCP